MEVYDEATCFYMIDNQDSNLTKNCINRSNNLVKDDGQYWKIIWAINIEK